jgi:hypothetical protein
MQHGLHGYRLLMFLPYACSYKFTFKRQKKNSWTVIILNLMCLVRLQHETKNSINLCIESKAVR